ncbi:MAG: PulJ/GspJ family protein [Bacillota bacterium]
MRNKLKSQSGMSLVEVVVSLAMLSIIFVPLSICFLNALYITKNIDRRTDEAAISRIAKELTVDSLKNASIVLNGVTDSLYNLTSVGTSSYSSGQIKIINSFGDEVDSNYVFTVKCTPVTNNAKYPNTSDVEIKILKKDDSGIYSKVVNKFTITVYCGS